MNILVLQFGPVMSDPPSSSSNNGISSSNSETPGGTSPSPVEGIESLPGPSGRLDEVEISLSQNDELADDYGEEANEEEENSSEDDCEVSSVTTLLNTVTCQKKIIFIEFFFFQRYSVAHFF